LRLPINGHLKHLPVDEVFSQLLISKLQAVALANFTQLVKTATPADLMDFFQYHIVSGMVKYSPDLTDGLRLKTTQGSNITIHIQEGDMYVNAAKVIQKDYLIANGVIHVLDK
jgi:uncharacterized surface protein with fasciclin (FAS1) repeats